MLMTKALSWPAFREADPFFISLNTYIRVICPNWAGVAFLFSGRILFRHSFFYRSSTNLPGDHPIFQASGFDSHRRQFVDCWDATVPRGADAYDFTVLGYFIQTVAQ
jgi:hypothetical protein